MTNTVTCHLFSGQIFTIKEVKEHLISDSDVGTKGDKSVSIESLTLIPEETLTHYKSAATLSLKVHSSVKREQLKEVIDGLSQSFDLDYLFRMGTENLSPIKLAVFDMDSTLIPMEVIDELAEEAGVKEEVAAITERAMQGELEFSQSFQQRLSLLRGMSPDAVDKVKQRLRFNPGVKTFIDYLANKGATVGIASGGFEPFAHALAAQSQITRIRSNSLLFDEVGLTGKAEEPIVDAALKAEQVSLWQSELSLDRSEILAVGDGANDSQMLEVAGLGVAYKAKPFLRQRADCVIQYGEMDGLIDVIEVALKSRV